MPGKQDGRSMRKDINQKKFIAGLKETGTISNGLRKAKISRSVYNSWLSGDPDFPERVADARMEFGEALEEVVVGIVMDPEAVKRTPVLAITLLNANLPWKYRPTGIVQEDTARDLLEEWKKAAQRSPKKEAVEETSVEKEISDILADKFNEK